MRRIMVAVFVLTLLSSDIWAQALSGTIVGTVTDSGGAIVPGVSVTVTNEGTGFNRTVVANESGRYVAPSFPTGSITVTAEQPGFQKLVRKGIVLTAADTVTVDLQLQVGSVEQTLLVNEDAPLLQTESATVSALLNNRQILDLPLNGRSFTQLLTIQPGATATAPNLAAGAAYNARANTSVSVNGSQTGNNSYLVDGMYNKGLWLNNLVIVPTIDSIQEVRVLASNFSAEYGDAAGSVTVVQSKSGTNAYHGSAYEFLRNNKLDANTFFNNRAGVARPPFRRNEFGGTVGGPIRQNRTFLFSDYQGIRLSQPVTNVSTVPTLAQRNMITTGNFSGLGIQIYDPANVITQPDGSFTRAPFPGNQIPVSRLDPAAIKLLNLVPLPQTSTATRNFTYVAPTTQRTDQFDVRLDQNFGASDRLFGKFSYDSTDRSLPGSLPAPENSGVPIGKYLTGGFTTTFRNWAVALDYTKVISSNIVNESRVGGVRWNMYLTTSGMPFTTATALGIPGINISNKTGGLPGFAISGLATIGDASTFPENSQTVTYQYEDILSVTKGSHSLKFGGRYLRHVFNGYSAFPVRGNYDFNGQFTRQVGTTTAATAIADFALGSPDAISRAYLAGTFGMRFYGLAGFAEDTWRATKNLTLSLGLRYEIQSPPYEVHDRWANFDVKTGKLILPNQNGFGRSLRHVDANNFGPRLGIAYQANSKTVVRTGFGVSYTEQYDGGTQLYKNLPFLITQRFTYDQNGAPGRRISDGLPFPVAPALTDPAINGGNPMAFDFNLQTPKILQWSLTVQREILRDMTLETSYIGTRGINLLSKVNTNQPFPGPGARLPRSPLYPLNPLVGDLNYHTNWADSKYHSLQARLQTRARRGLSTGVSYTWSHNLTNAGENQGAITIQDARCFRCEWGNSGFDRRHVFVINHVYELPVGKGRHYLSNGLLGRVVGGWNVSGVWSLMSGTYFTPRIATSVSNAQDTNNGSPGERPNRLADGNLSNDKRTIDRWFDTSAFAPAAQFNFGNAGNFILEGPGYFNLDAGIHRNFDITERWKAVLRWEMFNAFNHSNFNNPNATIGTPAAGQISGTLPARSQQVALKLMF